jgi:hypothetical protein
MMHLAADALLHRYHLRHPAAQRRAGRALGLGTGHDRARRRAVRARDVALPAAVRVMATGNCC